MSQKILHVVPSLRYGSAARQAALVSAGVDRPRFDCRVISLTVDGPAGVELSGMGIGVTALGSRGRIDPRPAWELRRILQEFSPDVIHAWQPAALRAVRLAAWTAGSAARLLVSRPLTGSFPALGKRLNGWLLGGVDCVVISGAEEREQCLRVGVPAARLRLVRAGVRLPAAVSAPSPERRFIACVGPIESRKGLKDAVWAFDVLHYLYNDLHLLLVGTGPHERQLRAFAQDVGVAHLVHFLGDRADVSDVFAMAEVVWVPGRSGGVGAIMEAMAAGRPIVASRLRDSVELLGDGQAGVLIPPNDPAELARQTRRLLDDADLRQRLGEAGRSRAARDFDGGDMVCDYQSLYEELTLDQPRVLQRVG